jgi:DNA repair protein SbcD/Mre11
MRILHTADWHFGKTLEGRDRLPEQAQFVDELCQICRDERVDLVLMAGDVFQTVNPSAQAEQLFYDTLDRLAHHGTRGVVVIAGNHDNPERLSASAPLAERLGITLIGLPKDPLEPSLYADVTRVRRVGAGPSWLELAVPGCAHAAVIAALPYPSEARLKELLSTSLDESEMLEEYNDRVQRMFAELAGHYRGNTVNLAMSHLFVRGGIESDSETQIQVGGTYAVHPSAFPAQAQYTALGHLHRPQDVAGGVNPVRYAGSPLAYSFSEVGYAKSVVIVDVEPGKPADVREIYLNSGKPLAKWIAPLGVGQVARWVDEGKDANAWIDLEVHLETGLSMEDTHMLRSLHPGFIHIRPVFDLLERLVTPTELRNLPVHELFRRFFERQKGFTPDDALVAAFLEVIAEKPDGEASDGERVSDASASTHSNDAAEEVAG